MEVDWKGVLVFLGFALTLALALRPGLGAAATAAALGVGVLSFGPLFAGRGRR